MGIEIWETLRSQAESDTIYDDEPGVRVQRTLSDASQFPGRDGLSALTPFMRDSFPTVGRDQCDPWHPGISGRADSNWRKQQR